MKNRIRKSLAALVPLLMVATLAQAAQFYVKNVPLQWIRTDASLNPKVYGVSLSDGNHPIAGAGINVSPQDTSQSIDVRDHWLRYKQGMAPAGPNGFVAGALVQDSLNTFGTVTFTSTKWTVDSLVIMRDISLDGKVWVAVDSIGAHVVADTTWGKQSAVSDSLLAYLGVPAVLGVDGVAKRVVTYSWNANTWFDRTAITSFASVGVNYIRFRIHLTPGDFAAAGTSDGYTGVFSYLALEPNYLK